MSADRWSVCPKCQQTHDQEIRKGLELLDRGYGTLTREEYRALQESVSELENRELPETLRQDYEIGIFNDGYGASYFMVDFRASCTLCLCDWNWNYDYRNDEGLV